MKKPFTKKGDELSPKIHGLQKGFTNNVGLIQKTVACFLVEEVEAQRSLSALSE